MTNPLHKDYSGTPLATKLGIREHARVLLVDAPGGFIRNLEPLPAGVHLLSRSAPGLDVVVAFAVLERSLARLRPLSDRLAPAGRLWVAWPKKASKVATELDFDLVQRAGLDLGLVDNKSASITEVFQGLQFVIRLRDR